LNEKVVLKRSLKGGKDIMQIKISKVFAAVTAFVTVTATAAALAVGASSAGSVKVDAVASESTLEAGDPFSIDIVVSDVPAAGFSVADLAISFDSSLVTIDSVTQGALAADTGADAEEIKRFTDSGITLAELNATMVSGGEYSCFDYIIADGQVRASWVTALESDFWVKTDGVLLTIAGTVNADTEGVAHFKVEPIDRETFAGSGVKNTDIVFGYLSNDNEVRYSVTATDASIKIGGVVLVEPSMLGDVNLSGFVDVADVMALCMFLVDQIDLSPEARANADVDRNGIINASDGAIIVQVLAGVRANFD